MKSKGMTKQRQDAFIMAMDWPLSMIELKICILMINMPDINSVDQLSNLLTRRPHPLSMRQKVAQDNATKQAVERLTSRNILRKTGKKIAIRLKWQTWNHKKV